MAGINVEQLAAQIAAGLTEYSDEITTKVKAAVESTSKETVSELKDTSPRRTGAYAKDWTTKKAYEDSRSKRKTVYNKDHYQISHLLEYGHAKRGGGRVEGRPHIKAAEERAKKQLETKIRREI